jgi:hypothetical protein
MLLVYTCKYTFLEKDSIFQLVLLNFKLNALRGRAVPTSLVRSPPLSDTTEPALLYTLLTEHSSKYKLNLDTEPNLSRQLVLSPTLPKGAGDNPALFIGDSNADRLANAAANVGIIPDTVTEGGWILNTSSVSTVIPQIEAYGLTLPP